MLRAGSMPDGWRPGGRQRRGSLCGLPRLSGAAESAAAWESGDTGSDAESILGTFRTGCPGVWRKDRTRVRQSQGG